MLELRPPVLKKFQLSKNCSLSLETVLRVLMLFLDYIKTVPGFLMLFLESRNISKCLHADLLLVLMLIQNLECREKRSVAMIITNWAIMPNEDFPLAPEVV